MSLSPAKETTATLYERDFCLTALTLDMFPITSPFTPDECLNEDFLPESPSST